jgi:hypothetical protein
MARSITPVAVAEDGTESHESWITLVLSKVSAQPGQRLFDSEITHTRYITMTVCRCTRTRDLNHDWKHAEQTLMEVGMSHAQWGAFVSAFGDGGGVPATLFRDHCGVVAQAPHESRMAESAREVHDAGNSALAEIQEGYSALEEAFERGAGKREMRDLIRSLKARIANAPANMGFAAESLTKHVENVVTKARSDVEAMAVAAAERGLTLDAGSVNLLDAGEHESDSPYETGPNERPWLGSRGQRT